MFYFLAQVAPPVQIVKLEKYKQNKFLNTVLHIVVILFIKQNLFSSHKDRIIKI